MSTKGWIIGSAIFLGLIIGMVFLFSGGQKPEVKAVNYSVSDSDKPKAEVDNKFADIGQMSVNDEKNTDFTLKNIGNKPLQILNVSSSCHCTFGQVIYKDFTSKEYSMGQGQEFVTEIAPGEAATIRIRYIPSIMPVSGIIEREVYVDTNDPANSKLVFSIQANVK